MSAPYDIPQIQNITSTLVAGNELLGNMVYGHLILTTIFLVTFFGLPIGRDGDVAGAAVFSALIGLIANILLLPLGIVTHLTIPIFLAIMIGGFFIPRKR